MEKLAIVIIMAVISMVFKSSTKSNKNHNTKRPVNKSNIREHQGFDSHDYRSHQNSNQAVKNINANRAGSPSKPKTQGQKPKSPAKVSTPQHSESSMKNIYSYSSEEEAKIETTANIDTFDKMSVNTDTQENSQSIAADITEDLQRSIIAAEIFGPPRAIKKSIR